MIEGGSVFHLLQNACIELSEISHELRSRLYKKPVYNKFLFSRMLWRKCKHTRYVSIAQGYRGLRHSTGGIGTYVGMCGILISIHALQT